MIEEPEIGWATLLAQVLWIAKKVGKITAIKHTRSHTGAGLKECKEFLDDLVQWDKNYPDAQLMNFPQDLYPMVNLAWANPENSVFANYVDQYEKKKLGVSYTPTPLKWDSPDADPLADVQNWLKKTKNEYEYALVAALKSKLQADPEYYHPGYQPKQKKVDESPSHSKLAKLVQEYRPTMTAEVVHAWAQDVITELNKLD